MGMKSCCLTYFESFVLKNFLDSDHLASVTEFSLVDDAERAVADHFSVGVRDFLWSVWTLTRSGDHCGSFAAVLACHIHTQ